MAILVPVTSDPENASPWLGLIFCQSPVCGDVWLHEKDFCVPGGRCVSLHVCSITGLGYLCQSKHECPGRVWMWVVCKWGERVRVCECVLWTPTMYETPLG